MKFNTAIIKRIISGVLALGMSLSACPFAVFAAEVTTTETPIVITEEGENYVASDGKISILKDSAASEGAYVGDFATYECVSLEMDIPKEGNYKVEIRYANKSSSSVLVNCGSFSTGKTSLPSVGGWSNYTSIECGSLWLSEGVQTITVTNHGSASWNFDKITLTYKDSVPGQVQLNAYEDIYLQNRWKSQRLAERDGKLLYSNSSDSDYSTGNTRWDLIPDGNGYYYIKNSVSNNYVSIVNIDSPLVVVGTADTDAEKWSVAYVDGNMIFYSKQYPSAAINLEYQESNPDEVLASTTVLQKWYSAQWKITVSEFGHVYTISGDRIEGTVGTAVSTDGRTITVTTPDGATKTWSLTTNISASPAFDAPNMPIMEAVYNLTVEEAYENIASGTYGEVFHTGANWRKVWSRDTAISVQYSLAWAFPTQTKNSLLEKIIGGTTCPKIWEEDTGTGGSYPTSDDRVILMIACWEYYLSTGDTEFLELTYEVTKNTLMQDFHVVYDVESGLMKGETCGLDHRDKTYPDWMSENYENSLINIAESKAANTNIIFAQVLNIMAQAGRIIDAPESEINDWSTKCNALKTAINNRLWLEDRGMYASWEYPNWMGSPVADKVDVLANGYALMFDIGTDEQMQSILKNYPLVTYGANTVWPQKTGNRYNEIYHNRGIWPGWEGTLMIGAKRHGNNQVAEEVFKSCVRTAAMCLTNKELIDYSTAEGVASDRQLWSVAATLAGYYRLLFGMEYLEDGIKFSPYVPEWMEGPYTLSNYAYRDAMLNVTVNGNGDLIDSMTVNGVSVSADYVLPTDASGEYVIVINMKDSGKRSEYHLEEDSWAVCPPMPVVTKNANGTLTWTENPEYTYKMWTGKEYVPVSGGSYKPDPNVYGVYCLVATDSRGIDSELSKPIVINPNGTVEKYEAEKAQYISTNFENTAGGYSGTGYVVDKISNGQCGDITFTIKIEQDGIYEISTVYNNYGDPKGSNNGGIRSILIDNKDVGTMTFPVMKFNYQQSSRLYVELTEGEHTLTITYNPGDWYDTNMKIRTDSHQNDVCFDYLIVRHVSKLDGSAPDHKCSFVCPDCGKCRNTECDEDACQDKCECNDVDPIDPSPSADHENCSGNFFQRIINAIVNFFRKLFGLPEVCICGEEL